MPLNSHQINKLADAISDYSFPPVYFDFTNNEEVMADDMRDVETVIGIQLRSTNSIEVKHGLANVLYWGYAQIGYRKNRVQKFTDNVTARQISCFQSLVANNAVPTMIEIRDIKIPQYSGISFVSKILMFLNPNCYCVLDQQLAQLRPTRTPKALNALVFGPEDTQIRITNHNQEVYERWRQECLAIGLDYFEGKYRTVDVERGIFWLIQKNLLADAREIYDAS